MVSCVVRQCEHAIRLSVSSTEGSRNESHSTATADRCWKRNTLTISAKRQPNTMSYQTVLKKLCRMLHFNEIPISFLCWELRTFLHPGTEQEAPMISVMGEFLLLGHMIPIVGGVLVTQSVPFPGLGHAIRLIHSSYLDDQPLPLPFWIYCELPDSTATLEHVGVKHVHVPSLSVPCHLASLWWGKTGNTLMRHVNAHSHN